VVGALLLLPIVIQGLRGQTQAYPFACYPTFEWMAPAQMPDLRIEVQTEAGWRTVPHARDGNGQRTQRQWGEIWSLAGVTAPVDPERLRLYFQVVTEHEPARSFVGHAMRVRFARVYLSVVPAQRDAPPLAVVPLAEMALGS
jgi:hypothetical protein